MNFRSNPPALNLWMNTIPSLYQLVGFLLVPVKVKVSFIVCFEHAITYDTGFLQLVLKVMENLSLFINFWAPQLNNIYRKHILALHKSNFIMSHCDVRSCENGITVPSECSLCSQWTSCLHWVHLPRIIWPHRVWLGTQQFGCVSKPDWQTSTCKVNETSS